MSVPTLPLPPPPAPFPSVVYGPASALNVTAQNAQVPVASPISTAPYDPSTGAPPLGVYGAAPPQYSPSVGGMVPSGDSTVATGGEQTPTGNAGISPVIILLGLALLFAVVIS